LSRRFKLRSAGDSSIRSSQELLVLEHRVEPDGMRPRRVDLFQDLGPGPRPVEEPDDLPVRVLELVVLERLRVLHDPLDLSQLDLAQNTQVFAERRAGFGGTMPGREGFGRFFGPDRGDKPSGAENRAQGRTGQSLFQR